MRNDEGHYILTDADIEAYKRILDVTYDLRVRSSGERGLETHGYWSVNAPAGDKVYYSTDGRTLVEAIENWFKYIKKMGTQSFFE